MSNPLDHIEQIYRDLYLQHGYSPKSLGWDKEKQFLRFYQLTADWDLTGVHILDVGCGFGDLLYYLDYAGVTDYRYSGIDIVPEFIEEAQRRHSGSNINFILADFMNADLDSEYDIAIASGTFNLKMDGIDGYEYISRNMRKMFELSRMGIAADFLSDKVDFAHAHNFNSSPEKILSYGYSLSRNVVLKNNFFPFEFAILINKDDSFRKETTLFNSIEKNYSRLITGM